MYIYVRYYSICHPTMSNAYSNSLNPSRTAVPFWGQTTQNLRNVSPIVPKRDGGPKRVKRVTTVKSSD